VGDYSLKCDDPDALWIVVMVEEEDIVDLGSKVKFPRGEVVYCGDFGTAFRMATKDLPTEASATGHSGHASATGDYGHASATGNSGHSSASGNYGYASASGYFGHASATGDHGHASAAGEYGHASAYGDGGHASASGHYGCSAVLGLNGVARCGPGGFFVLSYATSDGELRAVVGTAGVNGIEPGVWYTLNPAGEIVKVMD
jgi:hypothetical protein